MDNITWVGAVGVFLVLINLLNFYNSAHVASKNAHEPFRVLEERVNQIGKDVGTMQFNMERLKADVDHAHAKIRQNEENMNRISKAQNKALLAILLWIKEPQHEDCRRIDEAISEISNL